MHGRNTCLEKPGDNGACAAVGKKLNDVLCERFADTVDGNKAAKISSLKRAKGLKRVCKVFGRFCADARNAESVDKSRKRARLAGVNGFLRF